MPAMHVRALSPKAAALRPMGAASEETPSSGCAGLLAVSEVAVQGVGSLNIHGFQPPPSGASRTPLRLRPPRAEPQQQAERNEPHPSIGYSSEEDRASIDLGESELLTAAAIANAGFHQALWQLL